MLIDLKRIDEAKSGLESAIKKEPNNKILHFYLGYANSSLNNVAEAKKNYEEALSAIVFGEVDDAGCIKHQKGNG